MRRIAVMVLVLLSMVVVGTSVSGQEGSVTATSPTWGLVVHGLYDPYTGELAKPAEPPPGKRIVGAEVEIINDGPGALSYAANPITLRDAAGMDYPGGQVVGREPGLRPRTLGPGEHARGWVWYAVPADAQLAELVLVVTPAETRLPLDQVTPVVMVATPTTGG